MLIERTRKLQQLFVRINNSKIVNDYIEDICKQVQMLLFCIATYYTHELSVGANNPNATVYDMLYCYFLTLGYDGKFKKQRKQCSNVRTAHCQFEVLEQGNIRERCILICKILMGDPKYTILNWLLCSPHATLPSNIDIESLEKLKHTIDAGYAVKQHLKVVVVEETETIKNTCNTSFNFQKLLTARV